MRRFACDAAEVQDCGSRAKPDGVQRAPSSGLALTEHRHEEERASGLQHYVADRGRLKLKRFILRFIGHQLVVKIISGVTFCQRCDSCAALGNRHLRGWRSRGLDVAPSRHGKPGSESARRNGVGWRLILTALHALCNRCYLSPDARTRSETDPRVKTYVHVSYPPASDTFDWCWPHA